MSVRLAVLLSVLSGALLHAQPQHQQTSRLDLTSGESIYHAACAGCHGPGGEGAPQSTIGFDKPDTFPDFSACDQTTPELDADWAATIREGGRARGFSRIMPAFGDALTPAQIDAVVSYLRSLCRESSWPRGELNLPRPLVTEKAFPEDETVLSTSIATGHAHDVSNTISYEHRFGARSQIELALPFNFQHGESGTLFGGVGDIEVALKRVLYSTLENSRNGSILSVQGGLALPTGNKARGLGAGTTVFEAFAAYAKLLPSHAFVQVQGGTEQPANTDDAPRAVFARAAIGTSFRQEAGAGRMWSPMVEVVLDRDLETGASTNVDLVPQFQVTLSRRQHVRANVGLQVPVSNTSGRPVQVLFYVLWDWFDGGLREGWK